MSASIVPALHQMLRLERVISVGRSAVLLGSRAAKLRGQRFVVAPRRESARRALFDTVIGPSLFVSCDDRGAGRAALRRAG